MAVYDIRIPQHCDAIIDSKLAFQSQDKVVSFTSLSKSTGLVYIVEIPLQKTEFNESQVATKFAFGV